MNTQSNAPKEKKEIELITPRGEEPIEGKIEEKENSWNPGEVQEGKR